MSTIRKLRKTMVTSTLASELQKLPCKLANLSEHTRFVIRWLTRDYLDHFDNLDEADGTLGAAIQSTERALETGSLKIIVDQNAQTTTAGDGLKRKIEPTGKF